jgi:hypothetical protein
VSEFLDNRFTDHAGALPEALTRANKRAWDALGIALAGDGFLDQIKVFFTADLTEATARRSDSSGGPGG